VLGDIIVTVAEPLDPALHETFTPAVCIVGQADGGEMISVLANDSL
jgi:hypothetical protein